jgi:hypothetical protein
MSSRRDGLLSPGPGPGVCPPTPVLPRDHEQPPGRRTGRPDAVAAGLRAAAPRSGGETDR